MQEPLLIAMTVALARPLATALPSLDKLLCTKIQLSWSLSMSSWRECGCEESGACSHGAALVKKTLVSVLQRSQYTVAKCVHAGSLGRGQGSLAKHLPCNVMLLWRAVYWYQMSPTNLCKSCWLPSCQYQHHWQWGLCVQRPRHWWCPS